MSKILLIALLLASLCLVESAKLPPADYNHVIRVANFMTSPAVKVLAQFMTNGKLVNQFYNRILFPGNSYQVYMAKIFGIVTGAMTFQVGANTYTLGFSDSTAQNNIDLNLIKGDIMEGDDPVGAINGLVDCSEKQTEWGRYYFSVIKGVPTTTIEFIGG